MRFIRLAPERLAFGVQPQGAALHAAPELDRNFTSERAQHARPVALGTARERTERDQGSTVY